MSSLLVEQLDNSGLLRGRDPGVATLERLSKSELLDLLQESTQLTSAAQFSREQSIFSQSATLSLSGGRQPCINLECRLRHARHLAQYAALYADRVYVYNLLADHLLGHDDPDEEELKADLYDDLAVLGYLRPLIEAGQIVPITPPDEFCPRCFGYRLTDKKSRKRRETLYRWLSAKYLDETEVELDQIGEIYGYVATGPEFLLEHGTSVCMIERLPAKLRARRQMMARLQRGETVKLSRAIKEHVKLHEDYAAEILQNVFFELACSQCLGTAFLTDRPLHIEALDRFSEDRKLAERNHLIQRHLTTLVPFVSSARMEDLLRLREEEGAAFLAFRQALTRAVDNYRSSLDRPFRPQDASQLFGDVIEPSLAKLNQTVRVAKRRLLKGSAAKAAAWAGAISFGLYAGLVPADLAQAAAALGLTQILAELGTPVARSALAREEVATKEMYFLWRVREVTRRSAGTDTSG